MIGTEKQEPVFDLIKSMSKAEKRNFKLYATRLSGNQDAKFLNLFDVLDSFEEYDEAKVLERCSIKKEQLPNAKAHLSKQLLISLRLLNVQHSVPMQLREQLDFAHILYDKGLYKQSTKVLDKAYDLAVKCHQHTIVLDIIYFSRQVETLNVIRGNIDRAEEFSREASARCAIISKINELSLISTQLFSLHQKLGYARSQKDLDMIDMFFAPKLRALRLEELSFLERFYYFQAIAWFHYIKHDFVRSYRSACKWVALFAENQRMKTLMYDSYLKGYARILDGLYMMRKYKLLSESIDRFEGECRSLVSINDNAAVIAKNILLTAKINKIFLEGNFSRALPIIEQTDKFIAKNSLHISNSLKMWLYYKIACLYFGNADYPKCMQYLSKIISTKEVEIRRDVQCYSKMLYLIASYEAGIDYNLDYQIKTVYAFLVKMNDLQEVQKEFLAFLKRLTKIYEKDFKAELKNLYDRIKPYEHHPYLQRTFYYLDIISWLESKISGKTVSEIIRERFEADLKKEG